MDAEILAHIFGPFFTTKEIGKGTGLGLATVYGIVKQSGGEILTDSEQGIGTTFKVYLPRVEEPAEPLRTHASPQALPQGWETVLLVEDESGVRKLVRKILIANGYDVLEARNGEEAIRICEQNADPIHVLLTDVVMPRMDGSDLAKAVARLRPEMKVLFMSGYAEDAAVLNSRLDSGVAFISKPVTPRTLITKLREVLDDGANLSRGP